MKAKCTLVLLSIVFLSSCQATADLIYGTNKSRKYSSKSEYLSSNFKNQDIQTAKVYFLPKSLYNQLATEINSKDLSMYYGIAEKYFASCDQMEMKSCSGQFETFYSKFKLAENGLTKTDIGSNSILKSLNLNADKKTAIFIYSYKFGRLNKQSFEFIEQHKNDRDFDYRFISIDNLDIAS